MCLTPYAALGLSRNPFAVLDGSSGEQTIWLDRGYSIAPSPGGKCLVQFLGDKGFGKTSHLHHWRSQTGGDYGYYPPGWGRWQLPPGGAIAYWDEADRIPLILLWWGLWWGAIANSTIVVGTHRDLRHWAKLFGFTVLTIALPPLDAPSLQTWANATITAAQLPNHLCTLSLSLTEAQAIASQAKGSWRSAQDYLHIWAATQAKQAPPTP